MPGTFLYDVIAVTYIIISEKISEKVYRYRKVLETVRKIVTQSH